jgi:hypothetical protein
MALSMARFDRRRMLIVGVVISFVVFLTTYSHGGLTNMQLVLPSASRPTSAPGSAQAAAPVATKAPEAPAKFMLDANIDQPARRLDPLCDKFPDTSDVLVVVKTGASESFNRLPTQLMTVLRCVPEFFLYSDKEQSIYGHHVRDSLDTVLPSAMLGNKEFDIYRRQKECKADVETCNKGFNTGGEGWTLDKYKNIHIAEKVWAMRPKYKWYMTIDADTYMSWPTVLQVLKRYKHDERRFFGNINLVGDYRFGHGGSGYIVSHALMDAFIGQNPGVANEYDEGMHKECCGDYMFSRALKEKTGFGIEQMWPHLNNERVVTLPFGERHWCQPLMTLHHMNSEEISQFWEFEMDLYKNSTTFMDRPLLMRDVYNAYYRDKMVATRDDWDNQSDDRYYIDPSREEHVKAYSGRTQQPEQMNQEEKDAFRSFDHCRTMCENLKDCYQYRFRDGVCGISWAFKYGLPKPSENGHAYKSGWAMKRISEFIASKGQCETIEWPTI